MQNFTVCQVSFVIFQTVCHTSSFKTNPNFFCQKLHAFGTILCLLVINILISLCFTLHIFASNIGLMYTSLSSSLNH